MSAPAPVAWSPLRGVEFSRLREARLAAHHAVQWLARAARAFAVPQPDDAHTNLGWDDAVDGFTTHPLRGDARLALRMRDLSLHVTGGGAQQSFALDGRTDADARRWLGRELAAHGLDAAGLDAKPPYDIPDHIVARGGPYDVAKSADGLVELTAWFANARQSLGRVRDQMIARGLAPTPVRTWPHHFDMATLSPLGTCGAEHARSINAGFSPGDEHYEEPYFYVSPYPGPDAGKLPALPLGHWHVRGFTAAIALASRILEATDQHAAIEKFFDAAVPAAIATVR